MQIPFAMLNDRFFRPDRYYWVISLFLVAVSVSGLVSGSLDVQLHDTYFVLDAGFIAWISATIFLLALLVYNLLRWSGFTVSPVMKHFHLLTFLFFCVVPYIKLFRGNKGSAPAAWFGGLFLLAFLVMVAGHVVFFVNVAISLFRNRNL